MPYQNWGFSWENGKSLAGAQPAFVQQVLADLSPGFTQALAEYWNQRPDFARNSGIAGVANRYGAVAGALYAMSWAENPNDQTAMAHKRQIELNAQAIDQGGTAASWTEGNASPIGQRVGVIPQGAPPQAYAPIQPTPAPYVAPAPVAVAPAPSSSPSQLVASTLYDQARQRLGALSPAWLTASDQQIYDKVISDPTILAGSDPIRLAIQAAAYSVGQSPTPTPAPVAPQTYSWEDASRGLPVEGQIAASVQTPVNMADPVEVARYNALHPNNRITATAAGYDQYLAALPPVNKIVGRNFLRFDQDTRDFMASGYEAKGVSENQLLHSIGKTLPGAFAFGGPATPFGTVKR